MRKIHILYTFLLVTMLTACTGNPPETATQTVAMTTVAETETEALQPESTDSEAAMQIRVQGNGHICTMEALVLTAVYMTWGLPPPAVNGFVSCLVRSC